MWHKHTFKHTHTHKAAHIVHSYHKPLPIVKSKFSDYSCLEEYDESDFVV